MSGACKICKRDPQRMNSAVAECSHAACPHRKGTFHPDTRYIQRDDSEPHPGDALGRCFDCMWAGKLTCSHVGKGKP